MRVKTHDRLPPTATDREKIEEYSIADPNSGCWLWVATHNGQGYGRVKRDNKWRLATHVSYEVFVGKIPAGLQALHRCDTPACVNPNHLFLGTHADNMADMAKKGRQSKGVDSPQSKLNEDDVLNIVSLLKKGSSHTAIASVFDVERSAITSISSGRTWSHVTGADQ